MGGEAAWLVSPRAPSPGGSGGSERLGTWQRANGYKGRTHTRSPIPGPVLFGACCPAHPWPHLPPSPQCLGAAAAQGAPVSGVELDSLISQVKDLLPDLGEGFILACLEHCGYDPERVINDILEERLAPALRQLDRGLDRWGAAGGGSWPPACPGPGQRHSAGLVRAPSSLLCFPLFPVIATSQEIPEEGQQSFSPPPYPPFLSLAYCFPRSPWGSKNECVKGISSMNK